MTLIDLTNNLIYLKGFECVPSDSTDTIQLEHAGSGLKVLIDHGKDQISVSRRNFDEWNVPFPPEIRPNEVESFIEQILFNWKNSIDGV